MSIVIKIGSHFLMQLSRVFSVTYREFLIRSCVIFLQSYETNWSSYSNFQIDTNFTDFMGSSIQFQLKRAAGYLSASARAASYKV